MTIGRMFTVSFTAVAVSAAQDLFEITASSTKPLRVHAIELSQSSEVGDTAEEGLSILFRGGTSGTTSGSGGSSATPAPLAGGSASFTAEVNNTTTMTGGTVTTLVATNWNERISPSQWVFTEAMMPLVAPSARFTVELASAPADSLTMSGTMWVEEIG